MKKNLLICFALLLNLNFFCFGQSFEGTMEWKVTTEITDPKTKQEMEEAQKKLNDPATQAQLKQLETMQNDPQFKAMMEKNPQLKQQMDALKSGSLASLFPTGMILKIKNNNSLMQMKGGMIDEVLYVKAEDQSYMINRNSKTYKKVPKSTPQNNAKPEANNYKVTPTNETVKILDYNCKKYIVESTEKGKVRKQYIWATTEIKDIDYKNFRNNIKDASFLKQIDGMPLKMEMVHPQGFMTFEAIRIEPQSLDDSEFKIPAGFTETQMPGKN